MIAAPQLVQTSELPARPANPRFCPDICPGAPVPGLAGAAQRSELEERSLVGVAGFEPATPSSRTREYGFHPLKYQRFSITSVPIRSCSIHAKLWPTCGRLAL